jgi:ribosomal small subunit protein bTHX
MGKGDRKTTKGKINRASYGKARPHKGRVKASTPKISDKKKA